MQKNSFYDVLHNYSVPLPILSNDFDTKEHHDNGSMLISPL